MAGSHRQGPEGPNCSAGGASLIVGKDGTFPCVDSVILTVIYALFMGGSVLTGAPLLHSTRCNARVRFSRQNTCPQTSCSRSG